MSTLNLNDLKGAIETGEKRAKLGEGKGYLRNIESDSWYKRTNGRHTRVIVPFTVKTDKHPEIEKGGGAYNMELYVHNYIGAGKEAFVCLNSQKNGFLSPDSRCPICEAYEKAAAENPNPTDAEKKEIDNLKAKRRAIYNLAEVDPAKKKIISVKVWDVSFHLFEKKWQKAIETAKADGDGVLYPFYMPGGAFMKFWDDDKGGFDQFTDFKFTEISEEQYDEAIQEKALSLDEHLHIAKPEEMLSALGMLSQTEVEGTENKCPAGKQFGEDWETLKECEDCDLWGVCQDESNRIREEE